MKMFRMKSGVFLSLLPRECLESCTGYPKCGPVHELRPTDYCCHPMRRRNPIAMPTEANLGGGVTRRLILVTFISLNVRFQFILGSD